MTAAVAAASVPAGHVAAERYWRFAGRSARLVTISIGDSVSDAARSRALAVRAARIGMPLHQEVWGRQISQAACWSRVQQLNAEDSVFAVLLLPDMPAPIGLAGLRAGLLPRKDLMRPGAWHRAGPVRPGEIDCLIDAAISAHQRHAPTLSGAALQRVG